MKKIIISTLSIVILAVSCGKYEEGHAFSLKSKKSRLCREWKHEKSYYNGDPAEIDGEIIWNFGKDNILKIKEINPNDGIKNTEYNWSFSEDKSKIECDYTAYKKTIIYDSLIDDYTVDSFAYQDEIQFNILRLTSKELSLTSKDSIFLYMNARFELESKN